MNIVNNHPTEAYRRYEDYKNDPSMRDRLRLAFRTGYMASCIESAKICFDKGNPEAAECSITDAVNMIAGCDAWDRDHV